MKITEILKSKKRALSFEVFPPKTRLNYDSVLSAVKGVSQAKPDFISVTYGAGGGTSDYTVAIAREIKNTGITPLAHLSCINHGKADVRGKLGELKELGIENILALRGDIPQGFSGNLDYKYASQLVEDIKKYGGFCIGAACYPEGHPESETLNSDIKRLKIKADAGCDFLTTQMFFENDIYYDFLSRAQSAGINLPIIAGIMPVTSKSQINRIIDLAGSFMPERFRRIADRFGDDPAAMKQAGIDYATEQITGLYANGVSAVHVYSMNKPDVAQAIRANLSEIL